MSFNFKPPTNIKDLNTCPYYWGELDRNEAEAILLSENTPNMSFIMLNIKEERNLMLAIKVGTTIVYFPVVPSSWSTVQFRYNFLDFPVLRKTPLSLKVLSSNFICNATTYNDVLKLEIPKTLKTFLRNQSGHFHL